MIHDFYLHGDKDRMWEIGEALGLKGEALMHFRHALIEVKIRAYVDVETGEVIIREVDGIPVVQPE